MKKPLLIALIALTSTISFAQVPSYVPTERLVAWWPFNGNANDESGNGNNGTVNGATLTTDRNGNTNQAYSFDGVDDLITIAHSSSLDFTNSELTISFWVKLDYFQTNGKWNNNIYKASYPNLNPFGFRCGFNNQNNGSNLNFYIANGSYSTARLITTDYQSGIGLNNWKNVVFVNDNVNLKIYIDGQFIREINNNGTTIGASTDPIYFGGPNQPNSSTDGYFAGHMDDIGFWNRALTADEVFELYSTCNANASIQMDNYQASTNSSVSMTASTENNSVYWQTQSNNLGWQKIPENATYNGSSTTTLTVNNLSLSNHTQVFRVIDVDSSLQNCADTSNTTQIIITDTCITQVFDTITTEVFDTTFINVTDTTYLTITDTTYFNDTVYTHINVTDTLFINFNTTDINSNRVAATIKVYPNPATNTLYISSSNYTLLQNHTLIVYNSIGVTVLTQNITQELTTVDLTTWSGKGHYQVVLLDNELNVVSQKTIVLQ